MRFEGVIPAVMTPFGEDGSVDAGRARPAHVVGFSTEGMREAACQGAARWGGGHGSSRHRARLVRAFTGAGEGVDFVKLGCSHLRACASMSPSAWPGAGSAPPPSSGSRRAGPSPITSAESGHLVALEGAGVRVLTDLRHDDPDRRLGLHPC